jgi:nucleoside-diphosphate kinase
VGDIITRFERVGLKIIAAKLFIPSKEMLDKHYPADREDFVRGLGNRTLDSYKEMGLDPIEQFGMEDAARIGEQVRTWLTDFMRSGPVFAFALEGPHAIEVVRKIVGSTLPQKALPGTIRGDYSFDSSYMANSASRPIKNLIHASGNAEEAKFELDLWFSDNEITEYDTVHQKHMQ